MRFNQYVEIMTRWRDAPASDEVQSWENFSMRGWNEIRAVVNAHSSNKNTRTGEHDNLVFFTSGGVIATVLQQLLSLEFRSTMHALWQIRNASVTNLLFNSEGECLVDYNTVPHLQIQPDKSLITQI